MLLHFALCGNGNPGPGRSVLLVSEANSAPVLRGYETRRQRLAMVNNPVFFPTTSESKSSTSSVFYSVAGERYPSVLVVSDVNNGIFFEVVLFGYEYKFPDKSCVKKL